MKTICTIVIRIQTKDGFDDDTDGVRNALHFLAGNAKEGMNKALQYGECNHLPILDDIKIVVSH